MVIDFDATHYAVKVNLKGLIKFGSYWLTQLIYFLVLEE